MAKLNSTRWERDFSTLDEVQRRAIVEFDGPQMIIGGPGTGKTRTLTLLIPYLLTQKQVPRRNILGLTFSSRMAEQWREKVDEYLTESYDELWIFTFHGFCRRLLRENSLAAGVPAHLHILSDFEEWLFVHQFLKRNLPSLGLTSYLRGVTEKAGFALKLREFIRLLKQNLIDSADFQQMVSHFSPSTPGEVSLKRKLTDLAGLYSALQKEMEESGYLAFPDLVRRTVRLLEEHPEIRRGYQERFGYIIVDEFQEVDPAQFHLLTLLTRENESPCICVAGDPEQAIFKFRGSDPSHIASINGEKPRFLKCYSRAKVITLSRSYRCHPELLQIVERLEKRANSGAHDTPPGNAVFVAAEPTPIDEAFFIARQIKRLLLEGSNQQGVAGYRYSDFAVLLRRLSPLAKPLEEALGYHHIPYQIMGGSTFHKDKGVSFLISYLKALASPDEGEHFRRVLHSPASALQPQMLHRLEASRGRDGESLFHYIKGLTWWLTTDYPDLFPLKETHISQTPPVPRPPILSRLEEDESYGEFFQQLFRFMRSFLLLEREKDTLPLPTLIHRILNHSGLLAYLVGSATKDVAPSTTASDSLRHLRHFTTMVQEFTEVFTALQGKPPTFKELISQIDELVSHFASEASMDRPEKEEEGVRVMTIHQTKGRQFPVIFIPGLLEESFPLRLRGDELLTADELERMKKLYPNFYHPYPRSDDEHYREERRLLRAGMTKAQQMVYLTYSQKSTLFPLLPSRFLHLLNNNLPLDEESCHKSGLGFLRNTAISQTREVTGIGEVLSLSDLAHYLLSKKTPLKREMVEELAQLAKRLEPSQSEGLWVGSVSGIDELLSDARPLSISPKEEPLPLQQEEFTFSTWMLESYLTCPRKALYSAILNITSPADPQRAWRGVVKQVINLLNIPYMRESLRKAPATRRTERLGSLIDELWRQALEERSLPLPDPMTYTEAEIKEIINSYVEEVFLPHLHLPCLASRDTFAFQYQGYPFRVRVDGVMMDDNGRVIILNHALRKRQTKSTEAKNLARGMLSSVTRQGREQPPLRLHPVLAWLAVREGVTAGGLKLDRQAGYYLQYFAQDKEGRIKWSTAVLCFPGFSTDEEDYYCLSGDELQQVEATIVECCSRIKQGYFPARPSSAAPDTCQGYWGCPYANICNR
ncbi:hypothetical protein CEE39_04500 [bacterium (candidate division B38) B3_B38]|nr:MAG: hypothetical protein CEE39_04500 [bacterium (candidate division B38) B3_B38]